METKIRRDPCVVNLGFLDPFFGVEKADKVSKAPFFKKHFESYDLIIDPYLSDELTLYEL